MKIQFFTSIILFLFLLVSNASVAWDGYDYKSSAYIEIEKSHLVREGEAIEYYDDGSGEYKYGTVESINGYGSSVEVEVYDYDSGEYRTF